MAAEPPLSDAEIENNALLTRLLDQRWAVIVACVGVLAFWLRGDVTPFAGILFLLALGAATMVEPVASQRRRRLNALRTARAVAQQSVWPDPSTKRVIASLTVPTLLVDSEGVVRFLNKATISNLGDIRPGQPMALHFRQRNLVAALARVMETNQPEQLEYIERFPVERWFSVDLSPLRFDTDAAVPLTATPQFLLVQFQDLSAQKRIERMRVDFIANASHELRTPLASMSGFIETLLGPARNDETARLRFLNIMREQSQRMSRLIDDLLSLSRIEMKAHLKPTDPVDLGPLIGHVADTLAPLARDNDVKLVLGTWDDPVIVSGAQDELVQVFSNLIENAIKYGASGQRVEIDFLAETETRGPATTIRDFGPGIASEHVPRLTERFYRADVETSRQKQGTGLGLAIVKHILNRHSATLHIKTEAGKGAAFTVQFPRRTASAAAEKMAKSDGISEN
uniref:ATP-binding protein n=1 Tax=Pararhizobium sp. IMCC3301 TaxID=3067904 RepID=UPI00274100D1|nr:ATP-binding protein [Pararhizobium sp. IMCC3301]